MSTTPTAPAGTAPDGAGAPPAAPAGTDVHAVGRRPGAVPARATQYLLMFVVTLVAAFPLYWLVSSALKTNPDIYVYPLKWVPTDFRWQNFVDAWNAVPFGHFLLNSSMVAVIGTAIELFGAVLCAYGFAYLPFPRKNILFLVLLGAMMVPGHVVLLPNFLTIASLGWVNTWAGLIAPGLGSVFATFLLRQHFLTLPKDVLEAARMDGAGHLRTLFTVVLPLSRPILATVTLVTIVSKWNDFIWPLIVTNSDQMRTLPVGLMYLKNVETYQNWGVILAGTVMVVVPVLAVFLLAQRHIIAGLTQGATK